MFILTTYTINQDFSTYILSPNSTGTYNFSFLFVRLQKLEEMTQLELTREMLGVRSESASGIQYTFSTRQCCGSGRLLSGSGSNLEIRKWILKPKKIDLFKF